MKKIVSVFLLIILMACSFSGCSSKERYVISVGNEGVTKGVYTYYLDKILSNPKQYKVDKKSKEEVIKKATELSSLYAAAKSKKETKSLSTNYKKSAATDTENIWSLFSAYYKKIGVKKSDITEVSLYPYRLEQFVQALYGENGKEPTDEWELKEAFVDIYVGFKYIEAPLTKTDDMGQSVPLTKSEKNEIRSIFSSMAKKLDNGSKTIDELNEEYNASLDIIVTSELPVTLMKDNDPLYPEGFFEKVMNTSHGKAVVIESEGSIYLVLRETIATEQEDAFILYRNEILQHIHGEEAEKKLKKFKDKQEITIDEKMAERLYEELVSTEEAGSK